MVEIARSVADVLRETQERLRTGGEAVAAVWPTGFDPLDEHLGGGLRGGELVLIGGSQGLGKTTLALQLFRNAAAGGRRALFVSYEHEETGLLERLLVQEAAAVAGAAAPSLATLRRRLENPGEAVRPGDEALFEDLPGVDEARLVLRGYSDRLTVVQASGRTTTVEVLRRLVLEAVASGPPPLVVVDYLQKVSTPVGLDEDARVTLVVEALKDLALEAGVPVVAIVAATQEGIAPGHRLRVHELRGSSALAYEADVILLLNDKHNIVARQHLLYDARTAEGYRQIAVLSVEKNRSGRARIDMEFRKDFGYCRFEPQGNLVAEALVDERLQST